METQWITEQNRSFVECLPDGGLITSEQDALDLVGICGEHRTFALLLHETNLNEDFYDLRTGLAGAVLQKLFNYSIRVAAVLPLERSTRGRFGEMVLESNRGRQFRVFTTREAAVQWLLSLT